jgi:GNAT superfamily N-acetyltransferase
VEIPEWCPLEDVSYESGFLKQRGYTVVYTPSRIERRYNMFKDYKVVYGSAVRSLFQYTEGRIRQDNRQLFRPDENNKLSEDVDSQVYIEEGIIAGYWAASKTDPKRSIILVHPLYRNKGIGTLLMNNLHEAYPESPIMVGGTNVASIKIAIKIGLKLVTAGVWDNGKVWLKFKGGE